MQINARKWENSLYQKENQGTKRRGKNSTDFTLTCLTHCIFFLFAQYRREQKNIFLGIILETLCTKNTPSSEQVIIKFPPCTLSSKWRTLVLLYVYLLLSKSEPTASILIIVHADLQFLTWLFCIIFIISGLVDSEWLSVSCKNSVAN